MKLTALNSLKFKKLKRRLALTHWQTVGLLESLWLFTQANAIEGDIGRHSDEDIAAGIEWEGDATELIETLVECKLLDRCPVNRLLVHGWEEHAPSFVKGAISRHGKGFAKQVRHDAKEPARQHAKEPAKQDATTDVQDATLPNLTIPNQSLPNHAMPSEAMPSLAAADAAPSPTDFTDAWNGLGKPFPQILRMTDKRLHAFHSRVRDSFWVEHWRAAIDRLPEQPFLRGENDRGWVADVDFFLRPDTVQKIIEGKYAGTKKGFVTEFQDETAKFMAMTGGAE